MTRAGGRYHTIADLGGARICVLGGTTGQQALGDLFKARKETYQPVVKDTLAQAEQAYRGGQCDALSEDLSVLAGVRARMHRAEDHIMLPGFIADEPLGLIVREDDARWIDAVRWTLNSLILAESLDVTAQTAEDQRRNSVNPAVRRLLGVDGEFGARLGLPADWSFRAVGQVGNYGEVFARNLQPLGLERGRNALWNGGQPGALYAPPLR